MNMTDLKHYLESLKYDDLLLQEKAKELSCIGKNYLSNGLISSLSKEFNENQIKTKMDKRQHIETLIKNLPQPYQTVLYLKYISFFSFVQIADKLEYSDKRIYQLHKRGLEILLELSNESPKCDIKN